MSKRALFVGLAGVGLLLVGILPARTAAPAGPCTAGRQHRVYPVADLIVPVGGGKTQEDCLMRLIQSTISPRSWMAQGGTARIDYYPIGMALVVRGSAGVLDEVDDLLAALRRLQDVEVTLEVRFLAVSDACMAKLAVGEGPELHTRILDEAQVRLLLEAVQSDRHSSILQAPKITMFNGQQGVLDLSETQRFVTGVAAGLAGGRKDVNTGLRLSLLPVVTPDNRNVSVQLGVEMGCWDAPRPAGPVRWILRAGAMGQPVLEMPPPDQPHSSKRALRTTVKVGDGQTVLLTGWTQQRQEREGTSPVVLSNIPNINNLFRNVSSGKENEHLLVLLTSRVLVRREQEEVHPGLLDAAAQAAPAGETMPEPTATRPEPAEPDAPSSNPAGPEEPEPVPGAPEVIPPPGDGQPEAAVLHVRRRVFRLEYGLDNVGPTGVSKLAVWYTRDGKTWVPAEREVSARGHATVTVPEDGRWGFTLIPHSGAGLSESPPKPGDPPHVWVQVDTAAPQVKIRKAAARLVRGQGVLQVRYQASDERLAGTPITVACASSPDGPWTELAKDLPCTEEYTCPLQDLPHAFYVRVSAADQAGNVGSAVSGRIHADLKIPRVRQVKVQTEE